MENSADPDQIALSEASLPGYTVKPVLSGHSKQTPKIGVQDLLSPNASQKYCRMLQWEHSAILVTFIKLPFVIKTFILSIFERPLKTGFTVHCLLKRITPGSAGQGLRYNLPPAKKEYIFKKKPCIQNTQNVLCLK